MGFDLYPHQREALGKLANGKILKGGVGTGKTKVAVAYYVEREAPKDVYVITTAKKRDSFDWQDEFYKSGVGPKSRVLGEGSQGDRSGSRGDGGLSSEGQGEGRVGTDGNRDSYKGLGTNETSSQGDGRRGDRDLLANGSEDGRPIPDGSSTSELLAGGGYPDVSGRAGLDQGADARSLGDRGSYPYSLTVDSWNNIAKYADVAGAFFIFDEQRLVGSGDWSRKFLRIAKHNNWILLTATPGDTWLDYIPVFVANNFYKNRSAFKREHVVYNTFTKFPKVDRYIGVGKLLKHRRDLLVEMPYDRHTKRQLVEVPLRYDKEALEMVLTRRWNIYENRPLRDVAEMFAVGRRLVNSDPSRLEMVKELWAKHPRLIIFYNFNYELHLLRNLISFTPTMSDTSTMPIAHGQKMFGGKSSSAKMGLLLSEDTSQEVDSTAIAEWNGHKHEPIPSTKRWLYLVQYTAGAEGWNCIKTNTMIMHSRHYSWRVTEQAKGRIDRLNTPFEELWYYDFTTESFIDKAIGRALKAKKTFNESRYKGLFEA